MATESVSNIISPRSSSGVTNGSANSPKVRGNPRNLSSPWANIVRGESESVPAAPSSPTAAASKDQISDSDSLSPQKVSPDSSVVDVSLGVSDLVNSNAAKSKKPAWNKPSNGAVEVSPVMGAVSWPALSDSAKALPKSSSESLKALSDGSSTVSQGPVVAASPQKQLSANANPNSTTNHHLPMRQRSFKRGGGSANGGTSQLHPHPPSQTTMEVPQNNSTKTAPVVPGTSPRDHPHKSHNWEGGQRTGLVSQSHAGNDHQQQQNSFRRGGGGHHRGDGSNHYNHGNRRDQDRASHDSNPSHRGFSGRDGHMQQRVNQRNFVRPMQPSTAPFVSPPPIRPFSNPFGYSDMVPSLYYFPTPPPESLRGVPFFQPAPFAMILPPIEPPLRSVLTKQIEYYFSPENLCKDIYLRKYMDEQGWVPVSLIANFNRVKQLTNNAQFILDSVRTSSVVEVEGDKLRKRNDWMNWKLPSQPASSSDMLANRIQSVGLEDGTTSNGGHSQAVLSNSSSQDLSDKSKAYNGEGQDKLPY